MLSNISMKIEFFIYLMLLLSVSAGQSFIMGDEIYHCSITITKSFESKTKMNDLLKQYYKRPLNLSY